MLLWLDERGKTHRKMVWKRSKKVTRVCRVRSGIAGAMLYLSPSGGGARLGKSDGIWGRISIPWPSRKTARC